MKKTRPSDFTNYPWSSIKQSSEWESIAQNIMEVMEERGDDFALGLTLEQYVEHRRQKGHQTNISAENFEDIMQYCQSAERAKLFSKEWKDVEGYEPKKPLPKVENELAVKTNSSERGLIESALNFYWNDANTNLQRKDLGDLERIMYEETKKNVKALMTKIDLTWW
jgi:hypothetical protein